MAEVENWLHMGGGWLVTYGRGMVDQISKYNKNKASQVSHPQRWQLQIWKGRKLV